MEEAPRNQPCTEYENKVFHELAASYAQPETASGRDTTEKVAALPLPPIGGIEACIPRTPAEQEWLEAYQPTIKKASHIHELYQL